MLVLKVIRDDGTSTRYAFKADEVKDIRVEKETEQGAWFLKFTTCPDEYSSKGDCHHMAIFEFEEKALELMALMTSLLSTRIEGEDS
jgi:hypothetical protein